MKELSLTECRAVSGGSFILIFTVASIAAILGTSAAINGGLIG